jgi:hypothetical protein
MRLKSQNRARSDDLPVSVQGNRRLPAKNRRSHIRQEVVVQYTLREHRRPIEVKLGS